MSIRIIAEAGVNHNGNLESAKKLALAAKEAGADIVKFQTFIPELLVTEQAAKAEYQKEMTGRNESQINMLRKLALPLDSFADLKEYCDNIGIAFLSTAFDQVSAEILHSLGCTLWKIPSGEITSLPLIRQIAAYHGEAIISTGMCRIQEIRDAVDVFHTNGCERITLLHCTTAYPAPYDQINLKAIQTLRQEFALPVGFSDHSQGIAMPVAAAAMGCSVIEKHFTLDHNMPGPDHRASLEPYELCQMVQAVRQVEAAMGDGIKKPTPVEIENMKAARKSIVAACNIAKGEFFTEENLTIKRPGIGISPMQWDHVIGQAAPRTFQKDELICL